MLNRHHDGLIVRVSEEQDAPALQDIYSHHVLHGLSSFEVVPPDVAQIAQRRKYILNRGMPHLVAKRDGRVVGFAYAGPYRPRPAYRYTAENSVYVRADCARQGIGRALMIALLDECEMRGLRQIIAVIGDSRNHASIGLHRSLGFHMVGVLRSIGFKFGQWVNVIQMQRELGKGDSAPPPI